MNNQELRDLIAERLQGAVDAGAVTRIATLIADHIRPWVPDTFERESLSRLFVAARGVAFQGTIDHDQFICTADQGRALRAALLDHENLMEQRDREEQEAGEAAGEEEA